MIRQRKDFDIGRELSALTAGKTRIGLVLLCWSVRDMAGDSGVGAMTLEHYPGMTEKRLAEIKAEARSRWPLDDGLIIHRYGRLAPGDRIVLVATAAAHREAAFAACGFLIDWLRPRRLSEVGRDGQGGGLGRCETRRRRGRRPLDQNGTLNAIGTVMTDNSESGTDPSSLSQRHLPQRPGSEAHPRSLRIFGASRPFRGPGCFGHHRLQGSARTKPRDAAEQSLAQANAEEKGIETAERDRKCPVSTKKANARQAPDALVEGSGRGENVASSFAPAVDPGSWKRPTAAPRKPRG